MMRSMKVVVVAMLVSLVSLSLQVSAEETIRVFYNDANPVRFDVELPAHISVYGYNMDALEKSEDKMTKLITGRVGFSNRSTLEKRFAGEFSKFMNSDEFPAFYKELEQGAMNIGNAMRFQIKKLPAIVFNNESVIYGVRSLSQAITIFADKERK